MNITILRYDTLGSTNTEAAEHARKGADEGLCIIARQQTAGRGRHGRTWVSEPNAGLYFSMVLRPRFGREHLPLITLMAGVAVHDTLRDLGLDPDIKWVNDVLISEKKIAGILAEAVETPAGLAVILGIGINLRSENFSPDLAETATSIAESGTPCGADEVAERLTGFLTYFYDILRGPGGKAAIIDEWRRRSSYFSGREVRVTVAGVPVEGTTDGLEANGALRLRAHDGSITVIHAGDVERLRPRA